MAKEKVMNESTFAQFIRQKTAFGEMIRTRQDEKQSVIDEYRREIERYRQGQLSRAALATSATKVRRELSRLDSEIVKSIRGVRDMAKRSSQLAERQTPTRFEVSLAGVATRRAGSSRAATATRRKAVRPTQTARRTAARRPTTRRKAARRTTRRTTAQRR